MRVCVGACAHTQMLVCQHERGSPDISLVGAGGGGLAMATLALLVVAVSVRFWPSSSGSDMAHAAPQVS